MVNQIQKKFIQTKKFDFLDFGASKGESIEYGKTHLFGTKGLGVDLDQERVSAMNKAGYDCIVGDLTKIKIPEKCVRFIKMAHILEHMPDIKAAESVIRLAKNTATDFFVVTGPFFDEDEYLASKGFKLHWSDYPDHPYHLKVSELVYILDKMNLRNYEIYLRYPITDSSNPDIHPMNSPPHSHQYDPRVHPPKKQVVFSKDIWTDFVCYVQLRETKNWGEITKAYRNQIPYIERKEKAQYAWPRQAIKKYVLMDSENQLKDQEIQDLKTRVSYLQKQLLAIKSSKSWELARLFQKISFVIRRPWMNVKKSRSKFTL